MGWAVLYIAFGVVALWLLGEVLLQYKARLRWRMLAFIGFVGVVFGVLLRSLPVIGVGTAAFAIGQTFVTLSFRRGFSTGWAIGGSPGESRRRKTSGAVEQDPTLEVSDLEYDADYEPEREAGSGQDFAEPATAPEDPAHTALTSQVYAPEPMPDDTGQYGIYQDTAYPPQPAQAATGEYGYSGYDQQQYGYDTGSQQQYAAYSDPYIGTQTYGSPSPYDTYAGEQQGYGTGYQDPYGAAAYPGATETPPGGVWVPQQRNGDELSGGEPQPEQQQPPYQDGYGTGYDEQQQPYRY
ncbi:SCO2102 family sporulation regulator [Streptomyces apocyni]|uniref:SCO2102 family sporulation regulator n=1 Tax=Streptomyces apocyni TaxID=2654677 RepID=UPI0012EA494A|nr:hypothetical protein [Streptomyces apocyni]